MTYPESPKNFLNPFDLLGPVFTQPARIPKRKVFVSYHHGGDQQYYDAFTKAFADIYDVVFDNSLERRIDSDNPKYVIQRIRDSFITGSSCTIVFCGIETPWRKYVDWEMKATLDMEHGLIGVNLPTNPPNAAGSAIVPARLYDNIQNGYAIWTNWNAFTGDSGNVKLLIEQAVARPPRLIVNNRAMMPRNETPPWKV